MIKYILLLFATNIIFSQYVHAAKDNPIVLATRIATALFHEFGEETNELNQKGNKIWKLPGIKDDIPFRTTLSIILKENNCDIDAAIEDAKKKYKSGRLKKMIEEKSQAKKFVL
jgi:hypothetical protein